MNTIRHKCQAVVVGSGAGGAVAGAILAEAGIDTIIVEQGRQERLEEFQDILTSFSRIYINAGLTMTLGKPLIPIPLGRAVGGTTIINSSTCFRPPEDKVVAWGGPSYEEMTPHFEEVERRINAHVVDVEVLGGNYRVVKRGCDALGYELKPLKHNVKDCIGQGRCAFGCNRGAKQSMDNTFIPSAIEAGARLLTEHQVTDLTFTGRKIKGISGRCPEGRFEINADVVVLALGALTGPAFLLQTETANNSGCVGRGLRIHPAARVLAEFNEIIDGNAGLAQGAYCDHWHDRGIMLEGIFVPPGPLMLSLHGAGYEYKALAAMYRRMSAFGVMVSDTSQGRVTRGHLGTSFTATYQMNQADAETMRFAIARLIEIYLAAGAKRAFTSFRPIPEVASTEALAEFEKAPVRPIDLEMMAFHPLGTCAMGADPHKSVVNFNLETHDVPNLYIMDGSVIPDSLGVNPQVTIMSLAMRAASLLAEKLK